jgi:hypothetical protein
VKNDQSILDVCVQECFRSKKRAACYGGVGPAARAFLHQLASAGCEVTAESFLLDALIRLSVVLQRGNALVLHRGMQQLRVEQSALAGPDAPLGSALHPASRCRQLFGECSAAVQRFDLGDLFHASMRAGGGRTATDLIAQGLEVRSVAHMLIAALRE